MNSINSYAANTFTKGLIMDFDPTVTKNDSLVNALNATLLTFNGNEMQLQQDMGNGRVETAFLPEGYIPVGCCEFGGIIYVVSYNPLEDKSQVGCFPSPERNITSDEISDINTKLNYTDFQETYKKKIITPDKKIKEEIILTGELKTTGVRKILYEKSNLNPGDKYVIYTEDDTNALNKNKSTLTDFGNTEHLHNYWPKLLKINVVSIEDSGKIVNLNSSVKWYDNNYYITQLTKNPSTGKKDLDSYRSLVSSPYSIFSSKVSGKLAILVEPEMIDSFNCTYEVYTKKIGDKKLEEDKTGALSGKESDSGQDGSREGSLSTSSSTENTSTKTKYTVYFNTSWTSKHPDINPYGFLITESEWKLKETKKIKTIENGKEVTKIIKYISEVPVENKTNKYIEYKPDTDNQEFLKFNISAKTIITEENKNKIYYAPEELYTYRTLYNLAKPSDTYDKYKTENSYLAQINDKIDWYKIDKNTYKGLENSEDYSNVGPVTKITRIKDGDNFKYYYNLISIDSINKKYQTKGNDGSQINIMPLDLEHDIINNYFKKEVTTKLRDILELPTSEVINGHKYDYNNSKAIWSYTVAPAMPYGVLDHLAISGNIDFSKINSGYINMSGWRYFTEGDVLTLTFGLEAYPEPNKGIAAVDIDFFDNEGFAAGYHLIDKNSYSGQFTERIILRGNNYTINAIDSNGKDHSTDNNERANAGLIYPNMLYLCKITIKYAKKNALGKYDPQDTSEYKTRYRWLWTNGIFNNNYYTTMDYNNLVPKLELGLEESFDTTGQGGTNKLKEKSAIYKYSGLVEESDSVDYFKSLAANITYINQNHEDDENGNILLRLVPKLKNNYNTFKLNSDLKSLGDVELTIKHPEITFNNDAKFNYVFEEYETNTSLKDAISPILNSNLKLLKNKKYYEAGYIDKYIIDKNKNLGKDLFSLLKLNSDKNHFFDLYESNDAYKHYTDSFSLNFSTFGYTRKVDLKTAFKGIPLTLSGYMFSKIGNTQISKNENVNTLIPILAYNNREKYGTWGLNMYLNKYFTKPSEYRMSLNSKNFLAVLNEYHLSFHNTVTIHRGFDGKEIHNGFVQSGNAEWEANQYTKVYAKGGSPILDIYWGNKLYADIKMSELTMNYYINKMNAKYRADGDTTSDYGETKLLSYYKALGIVKALKVSADAKLNVATSDIGNNYYQPGKQKYNICGLIIAANHYQPYTSWGIGIAGGNINKFNRSFDRNLSSDIDRYLYACTYDKEFKLNRKMPVPFNFLMWNYGETSNTQNSNDNRPLLGPVCDNPVYTFAVLDTDTDKYVPFNDYFLGGLTYQWTHDVDFKGHTIGADGVTDLRIEPNFTPKYFFNSDIKTLTLADMIGSLFSQIYTVEDIKKNYIAFKNIISVSKYTEYWTAKIDYTLNNICLRDSIIFHSIKYNLYVNSVMLKIKEFEGIDIANSAIAMSNVLIAQKLNNKSIDFKYETYYNINNLIAKLNIETTGKTIVKTCYKGSNGKRVIKIISQKVDPTKFYTLTDNNLVILGRASTVYYAKHFEVDNEDNIFPVFERDIFKIPKGENSRKPLNNSIAQINSQGFEDLAKIIRVENGILTWHGLSKLQKFNDVYSIIWYYHNHADRRLEFPKISLFNEYNVE